MISHAFPSVGLRHGPVPALCFAMVPPETPQVVSIGLRNCYVARFQLPPEAPQPVSIGLRHCYVARFERPLKASKASKAPQQLSKAFEPQNPPQQLATAPRFLCHGTSRGPTSCFYRASKLLRGTFWTPLKSIKSLKSHTAAFEGLWTVKPPQQLARASRLLAMGPPEAPQAVSILRLRNYYVACLSTP